EPAPMLFPTLMAIDVEECIRAYPLDSVVLLAACDKTTPAMLMGAASADVPAIMVTGGPMLKGMWCNQELGAGTDARKRAARRPPPAPPPRARGPSPAPASPAPPATAW